MAMQQICTRFKLMLITYHGVLLIVEETPNGKNELLCFLGLLAKAKVIAITILVLRYRCYFNFRSSLDVIDLLLLPVHVLWWWV